MLCSMRPLQALHCLTSPYIREWSYKWLLSLTTVITLLALCLAQAQAMTSGWLHYTVQGRMATSPLRASELTKVKQHPAISGSWQKLQTGERLYFLLTPSGQPEGEETNSITFTLPTRWESRLATLLPAFFYPLSRNHQHVIHGLWQPLVTQDPVDFTQSYFQPPHSVNRYPLAEFEHYQGEPLYLIELTGEEDKERPAGLPLPETSPAPLARSLSGGGGVGGPGDQDYKPGAGGVIMGELFIRVTLRLSWLQNYVGAAANPVGQKTPAPLAFPETFDLVLQTLGPGGEVISERVFSEEDPELYQWYLAKLGQQRHPLGDKRLLVLIDKNADSEYKTLDVFIKPRLNLAETLRHHQVPGIISCPRGQKGTGQCQPKTTPANKASTLSALPIARVRPFQYETGNSGDDDREQPTFTCPVCFRDIPIHQRQAHRAAHTMDRVETQPSSASTTDPRFQSAKVKAIYDLFKKHATSFRESSIDPLRLNSHLHSREIISEHTYKRVKDSYSGHDESQRREQLTWALLEKVRESDEARAMEIARVYAAYMEEQLRPYDPWLLEYQEEILSRPTTRQTRTPESNYPSTPARHSFKAEATHHSPRYSPMDRTKRGSAPNPFASFTGLQEKERVTGLELIAAPLFSLLVALMRSQEGEAFRNQLVTENYISSHDMANIMDSYTGETMQRRTESLLAIIRDYLKRMEPTKGLQYLQGFKEIAYQHSGNVAFRQQQRTDQ